MAEQKPQSNLNNAIYFGGADMAITAESIKKLIVALGFIPVDGETDVFDKKYPQHNGYALRVDFANKTIEYADTTFEDVARITVGSKATSNFTKQENFVVLECVDRLLEKGYSPNTIELEKIYPSGRGHSGELDILVNDKDGQAFLMIECKTWGKEYTKEIEKMIASGGQLFTYFKNATSAKSLCLYTSRLANGEIEYANSIVDISEDWKSLSETKDIHERWNKNFKVDGIFQKNASPYNIVHKRLVYDELAIMKDEDSRKIFHQIMTILRHNGVSDKPNAFNKLLNLFVCKIIDEVKNGNPHDELQFQCWDSLSDEKLQMTLNDLYKEGMLRFLEIRVIDHSENEISGVLDVLGGDEAQKQKLMNMFIETRLKKSPNFAFIEVQDEKTFQLNAKIVREIVELLQHYKFRYEQKHEFLGNFFEKMLNTSMKQEAGQFFTPVPIARFIISSLPLREFVQRKIDAKESDPLPTVIDYACGSGHFLTEFMSAMQTVIEGADVSDASPRIRGKLNSWSGEIKFDWADEYVYGIDFDNRLVKTAKVSSFFNGDGEATIIWGDGLDSFEHSEVYRGKLKETMLNKQDNGQFDILISNPPYSVEAFRRMLRHGAESFDLYNGLTDNSSEIECLFIERMKQLLKIGGWAGVILPSSMLSNSGIYSRTRDIIFKFFNVKSIVELGSGTFMETGTNTVILFLERRPDSDHEKISQAINTFFTNKRDVTVSGIERAFSAYVANVYDDLCYEDYLSFISENPNSTIMEYELYKDYIKEFDDALYAKAFEIEKEKMLYFFLTYNQNIVVAKSGQKHDEKAFLGYEFSKRRGYEGIKYLPMGTMLFDANGDLSNPQKVNSHILNAFLGNAPLAIDGVLENYVSYGCMSGFFEYGTSKFSKRINLKKKNVRILGSNIYPQVKLGNGLVELFDSLRKPVTRSERKKGEYPYYGATGIIDYVSDYIFDGRYVLIGEDGAKWGENEPSSFIVEGKCWVNNHAHVMKANPDILDDNYLIYILNKMDLSQYITGEVNVPKLNQQNLLSIAIPLPPIDVQRKIVADLHVANQEIGQIENSIYKAEKSISAEFLKSFGDPISNPMGWQTKKLVEVTTKIGSGATPKGGESSYVANGISLIRSMNVHNGYFKYDGLAFITDEQAKQLDGVTVQENDVLLNITGASVARTCVVPSDVLPARVNQHVSIIRCDSSCLNPIFTNAALTTESYQQLLISTGEAAGMSRQAITKAQIESLFIILPPIKEQNKFSDFCKKTYALIASHQQALNNALNKRDEILLKHL